jgi:hypothetical protein
MHHRHTLAVYTAVLQEAGLVVTHAVVGGWPGLWVQEAAVLPAAVPAAPRLPRLADEDRFPLVPHTPIISEIGPTRPTFAPELADVA